MKRLAVFFALAALVSFATPAKAWHDSGYVYSYPAYDPYYYPVSPGYRVIISTPYVGRYDTPYRFYYRRHHYYGWGWRPFRHHHRDWDDYRWHRDRD